jgi:uncharacterized membrane protein
LSVEPREYEKRRVRVSSRLTPHSFADIIFGLAVSIGALVLTQSKVQVWQDFAWNVLLFGFSFLIIAITWLMFSRIMSVLPSEVPSVLFLNLILLFCVALEPYLFYMLMNGAAQNLLGFTSVGYALDVGFIFVVLATLASFVLKQERVDREDGRSRLHPNLLQTFKHMMIEEYIVAALFLVSALPVFWVPTPVGHLRFVFWYSSFVIPLIAHGVTHRKSANSEKGRLT